MHGPLDAHLHTAECNEIIKKLQECHEQNSKLKQFTMHTCDALDTLMRKCTRKERLARVAEESEKARERNKVIGEKMRQARASGKTWRERLDEMENK